MNNLLGTQLALAVAVIGNYNWKNVVMQKRT
jgi:hypothetical protein